jgi:acyl carrier protein
MENKILRILNTVLENRGKKKLQEFHSVLDLRKDLDLDSLDLAELTVRLESEFEIDIFENGNTNTLQEVFEKLTFISE